MSKLEKKRSLDSFKIPLKGENWIVYCFTEPNGTIRYVGPMSSFHPDFVEYLKCSMVEGFEGSSSMSEEKGNAFRNLLETTGLCIHIVFSELSEPMARAYESAIIRRLFDSGAKVINKRNGPAMALLNEMEDRDDFIVTVSESARETIDSEDSPITITHANYKQLLSSIDQNSRRGTCLGCSRTVRIAASGFCDGCWNKDRGAIDCASCGKASPTRHNSKFSDDQICKACWNKEREEIICASCGKPSSTRHNSKKFDEQICKSCWNNEREAVDCASCGKASPTRYNSKFSDDQICRGCSDKEREAIDCASCGKLSSTCHNSKKFDEQICKSCWNKDRGAIDCASCGKASPTRHNSKLIDGQICRGCWDKEREAIDCANCGKPAPIRHNSKLIDGQICRACYKREYRAGKKLKKEQEKEAAKEAAKNKPIKKSTVSKQANSSKQATASKKATSN